MIHSLENLFADLLLLLRGGLDMKQTAILLLFLCGIG